MYILLLGQSKDKQFIKEIWQQVCYPLKKEMDRIYIDILPPWYTDTIVSLNKMTKQYIVINCLTTSYINEIINRSDIYRFLFSAINLVVRIDHCKINTAPYFIAFTAEKKHVLFDKSLCMYNEKHRERFYQEMQIQLKEIVYSVASII